MRALLDNRTRFPLRQVRKVVLWVLRELDANLPSLVVRVKETDHSTHHGRFYQNPRWSSPKVWDEKGATIPEPPYSVTHLIVARVPISPNGKHDRGYKTGPPPIDPQTWQESLVCIVAHEAMHLKQYLRKGRMKRRYSEVEAEWAEYRLLKRWRERKK